MTSVTIAHCLAQSSRLQEASDSARLDIEVLLAWILGKSRTYLYTWPEKNLTPEQAAIFEQSFNRRLMGEPVAHITGYREFWSLPLQVNATTLIPRPDTELLVEQALMVFAQDAPGQVRQVMDLGTGTGAIALALASENPHWQLLGLERAPDAMALAILNRDTLGLRNVNLVHSDWFEAVPAQNRFDLVVSNPPYIDPDDPHLSQGDVRFEPLSALIAEEQGLADIRFIVQSAPDHLLPSGWLLLEHGWNQGDMVRQLLLARGFQQVTTRRDMSGHERVTLGQWNNTAAIQGIDIEIPEIESPEDNAS